MTKIALPVDPRALPPSAQFGVVDALHPNGHSGTDFPWFGGNPAQPIYSAIDGVVTEAYYGNYSPNGLGGWMTIEGGDYVVQYGHLNANSDIGIRVGDRVTAGQQVAVYGVPTTGYSTGPHVHVNLFVRGVRSNILDYVGVEQSGGSAPVVQTGWVVGTTDFKGSYGYNEHNGGKWYVIEPDTGRGTTIWDICQRYGVDLGTAAAYSQKVAGSKWGGQLLQAGSSWWDGSDHYYAGVCVALNDIAAIYDATEAQAVAAQAAEVAAREAATAADAIDAANQAASEAKTKAEKESTEVQVATAEAVKALADQRAAEAQARADALAGAIENAKAVVLPQVSAQAQVALYESGEGTNSNAPLSGLMADKPKARKATYYVYAGLALAISIMPDMVTFNVIQPDAVPWFSDIAAFASSALLKVGAAFGFVAASNTATKKSK